MVSNHFLNFITTIKETDMRRLLNHKGFAVLQGQLIFEKEGEIYVTNIEDSVEDYTVEDYNILPEGAPFELINGKLTYMPSPIADHQKISMNLSAALHFHTKKKKLGRVLTAPMDVHFDKKNVYQPDILFVTKEREEIIVDFIHGAPDLIVEITSPGTKAKDESEKMKIYGKFGVIEYWLVEPPKKTLTVYLNEKGKMVNKSILKKEDVLKSVVLDGFKIKTGEIFE